MSSFEPVFCHAPPSEQNALDIFEGAWTSGMPAGSGLRAGPIAAHFTDARVPWAASVLGGLGGKTILELGPFEAYNTYQFEQAGATVTSIESSNLNFLKCLIVKNTFGLATKFVHGDFVPFVNDTTFRYDICWASGVLYHMTDPVRLLQGIGRVSDTLFVWTQYYDATVIDSSPAQSSFFRPELDKRQRVGAREVTLHHRSYQEAKGGVFSGGDESWSYWMDQEDILGVLADQGFDSITMGVDNPAHPAGPACFFVAQRTAAR